MKLILICKRILCNLSQIIFICGIVALLPGCSTVQPWERDLLAKNKMLPIPDPMTTFVDEHIYFSKEAASGGQGVGGGGCGCN